MVSATECAASDNTAAEPVNSPAANLSIATPTLAANASTTVPRVSSGTLSAPDLTAGGIDRRKTDAAITPPLHPGCHQKERRHPGPEQRSAIQRMHNRTSTWTAQVALF